MKGTGHFAVIAGGGIGGLTTALCLVQRGWTVQLLEAAQALEEVGAGLQLSPNGVKVLRALGLEGKLMRIAFAPEALELRHGRTGRQVFRIALGAVAEKRWGAPYLHVHRADLVSLLADALTARQPGSLRLGIRATGYISGKGETSLLLETGETISADLIIGADGLRSAVRQQMRGPDAPRFTGNLAWRATVPMDRLAHPPPPTACVWAGRGRHAVTYRLRGGTLANFVGVVEQACWQGESWTEQGERADVLHDFSGWPETIMDLIEKADTHYRWALFDRAPLPRWHDGRVTLLGDACHPMLPFMAQGAVMAIEDAWVLAEALARMPDIEAALAAYEACRKSRTSKMQAASRSNAGIFHRATPISQIATYAPMWLAGQVAPGFVRARQDWIYGYDVTATDQ